MTITKNKRLYVFLALMVIMTSVFTISAASAAGSIALSVVPSAADVAVGGEITFTIRMNADAGTDFSAFSFKIDVPEGLKYKSGSGSVTSAFRSATGIEVTNFDTEPALMISGFGEGKQVGGELDIAVFTCTAEAGGQYSVTLKEISLLDSSIHAIPSSINPASVTAGSGNQPAGPATDSSPGPDSSPAYDSGPDSSPAQSTPGSGSTASPAPVDSQAANPAAAQGNPFADVQEGAWYYSAVVYAYSNNLMNGTGTAPMLFSPGAKLTRGMAVTVLHNVAGNTNTDNLPNTFNDVDNSAWYANAVKWAVANNIVYGMGEGKFAPNSDVTRQDLAVILGHYADFARKTLPSSRAYTGFADGDNIANYAKSAVERLYSAGIISGKENNRFDPRGSATRAEFAAILQGYMNL